MRLPRQVQFMNLNVNEIFYSLQGEGGRTGEASIFIRLSKCNLACNFCDTEFKSGTDMRLEEISDIISIYPCQWIIWTGGEPTLQLTDEILIFFQNKGYKQAIESNGTNPISSLLDYIVCSPKSNYQRIREINPSVDEIRLPVKSGDKIPILEVLPHARFYLLSPIFEEDPLITKKNISYCVEQIKQNPHWRLSIQIHKLINIP